jgi:D-arginine dehydrogenase
MMAECDFLIIGAGIAGASAAFEISGLAPKARVILVEREDVPGYHATGRSAALFIETYGGVIVRALARSSRPFLQSPPAGFTETPLLTPRGVLYVARGDQREAAERLFDECRPRARDLRLVDGAAAVALQPALRPDYAVCAVHEPGAMDLDVDALHQGYLRGFKARGGTLLTAAEVQTIERRSEKWRVTTSKGEIDAATIINAAGAWADPPSGGDRQVRRRL